jgi:hypothetical protein
LLAKVSLIEWPFPSDNSEVPDFADYEARDRYVAGFINHNLVFEDVAYDGRVNTNIRLELATTYLEEICGCWTLGAMNYCKVEYFDKSDNVMGCRFYFIDGIDVLNSYYGEDAVGTLGNSVVSLNIRADPWMNSMLPLRDNTDQAGICRPCIVEQAHVNRWSADSTAPNIYPVKEGCDGWRQLVNQHDIKTFNEKKGGSRFEIYVISWLENNNNSDALPEQHVAVFIPGEPIKVGLAKYTMPSVESVISGNMSYRMGITADSVLFIGPAPYLPVKVGGNSTDGYELSYLIATDSLGGESYYGIDGSRIGSNTSDVYALDITGQAYPDFWSQDASGYLDLPTKPTWTAGGIPYSEDAEPALFMEPYREDIICDGQGMPQFTLPDSRRFDSDLYLYAEPAIDPGGYSTGFELGRRYVSSPYPAIVNEHNRGMLGTRTVIDAPNGNIIASKWLDYSLNQRAIDLQYKKQTAFVEGIGGIASSVSTSMIAGNAAGLLSGITSGLIGAGVTQEKYRLDRDYNDANIRNMPNQMAIVSDGGALIKHKAYMLKVANLKLDDVSMQEAASRFMLNGYNLNMLMTPRWTDRRYFNYIRTRNINLSALVPRQRDMRDQLEGIFNRGVRVWHMDRVETDGMYYSDFDFTKENIEQALIS